MYQHARPHRKRERFRNFHARLNECPEGKQGLEQRSGALGRISNRLVRHVYVKVAHVDNDRLAVRHVRSLVPKVREPVHLNLSARLEPPLQLLRLSRGAKSAHRGFAARVLGRREVWADRVEVLGQRGGEGWDG